MSLLRPLICLLAFGAVAQAETLTIQGSSTVAQALTAAAPALKEELGLDLRLVTEGGSTGGILAIGAGTAQLAISTRSVEPMDRALFPDQSFDEGQIGWQVAVPVVAADVWRAGVRALTKEQLIGIYEGKIRNWKEVGGPDQPLKFYNLTRGRGVWELFAGWLYGDLRQAPSGIGADTLLTPKDARDALEFNNGSITLLVPSMVDRKENFALSIQLPDGTLVDAQLENLVAKKYPMSRPLLILSGRRIAGTTKRLVDFMNGPKGREILIQTGFVPMTAADKISP